jgi:hypothetical protein
MPRQQLDVLRPGAGHGPRLGPGVVGIDQRDHAAVDHDRRGKPHAVGRVEPKRRGRLGALQPVGRHRRCRPAKRRHFGQQARAGQRHDKASDLGQLRVEAGLRPALHQVTAHQQHRRASRLEAGGCCQRVEGVRQRGRLVEPPHRGEQPLGPGHVGGPLVHPRVGQRLLGRRGPRRAKLVGHRRALGGDGLGGQRRRRRLGFGPRGVRRLVALGGGMGRQACDQARQLLVQLVSDAVGDTADECLDARVTHAFTIG